MKSVLISGYYGFDNLGDEAVLLSIVNTLKNSDKDLQITVLSENPEITEKRYGVKSVKRTGFFDVLKAVRTCDLLISGGGSLLQDVTSRASLFYYLAILFMGIVFRKKVMVYGQGIGPLTNKTDIKMVSFILKKVNLITLRDNSSQELLKSMGIENNIHVTADPVFCLKKPEQTGAKMLLESEGISDNFILVSVRNWYNNELFRVEMAKALDIIYQNTGTEIVFCPFHQSDIEECNAIADFMKSPKHILRRVYNPEDMLGIISLCKMVIGMRLHSLIFGALVGCPVEGISYDPKIDGFLKDIGLMPVGNVRSVTAEQIADYAEGLWTKRDKAIKEIEDRTEKLRQKAAENGKLALSLIYGTEKPESGVLGVRVDNVTMKDAYSRVFNFVQDGGRHVVYTPNAEIIMSAHKDSGLKNILNSSDLNVPDGIGVVMAAKIYGYKIKERVAGVDLLNYICKSAPRYGHRIYFLGGKPGIAGKAAEEAVSKYGNIKFVGTHDGYFDNEEEKHIIEDINSGYVDFLFVGLGAPKQEIWIHEHTDIKAKVIMGVGGSFDVLAGTVKRAPAAFQRLGLEWLYRLIKEPRRFKRMLNLPAFMITVLREKMISRK